MGDQVMWCESDDAVPPGTVGTVVGFLPDSGGVRVAFPAGVYSLAMKALTDPSSGPPVWDGQLPIERPGHGKEYTVHFRSTDMNTKIIEVSFRPAQSLSLSLSLPRSQPSAPQTQFVVFFQRIIHLFAECLSSSSSRSLAFSA